MATINQKEKDGSTTLRFVDDTAAPAPAATPGIVLTPDQPAQAPISRTVDAPVDAASSYLETFTAPESKEQIAERRRKDAQGLIDSTSQLYETQLADERQAGQERLARNNAVNIMAGLAGSTEAVRTDNEVSKANQKAVDAINAKRAAAVAAIFTKISSDADAEALQQKEDATRSAEAVLSRRKQAQTDAIANLTTMAQSGAIDFDAFKTRPENAKVYQYALDAVGGSEDALRSIFTVNRPQDSLVGTPVRVGDHYVQAYKNPQTGKVSFEQIAIPGGLPPEYTNFQKVGDNIVAIPTGWDGDTTKLKTIAGSPSTMERLQQQMLSLQIQKTQQELTANDPAAVASKAAEQKEQTLTIAKQLRSAAEPGKSSAVGASAAKLVPFGQALGLQGDRSAFEARVDTLKASLTLDNLKLLKGAMSDKDLAFLQAVGSSLNTSMSEAAFDKEMDRIILKLGGVQAVAEARGFDYGAMKADGHDDDEIQTALGI